MASYRNKRDQKISTASAARSASSGAHNDSIEAAEAYIEEYQTSARQRRASLARERAEALLADALNIMIMDKEVTFTPRRHKTKSKRAQAARSRRHAESDSHPKLSIEQLDQLVEALQFAKQAAILALEMDGGTLPQPERWLSTVEGLITVISKLHSVTVPKAPPGVVGYHLWPLNDGDVLEYAGALCRMHRTLRKSLTRLIPFDGLRCDPYSAPQGVEQVGQSSLGAGGELLRDAPLVPSTQRNTMAAGGTEHFLRRLETDFGAPLSLRTHQLWPTLVSTINLR